MCTWPSLFWCRAWIICSWRLCAVDATDQDSVEMTSLNIPTHKHHLDPVAGPWPWQAHVHSFPEQTIGGANFSWQILSAASFIFSTKAWLVEGFCRLKLLPTGSLLSARHYFPNLPTKLVLFLWRTEPATHWKSLKYFFFIFYHFGYHCIHHVFIIYFIIFIFFIISGIIVLSFFNHFCIIFLTSFYHFF
jgi:cellulose synthase/poly-beta-1,6-N-acetylglucosamine synthase-like glycosyltransferase